MLIRKIPLPQKNNKNFDAVITADEKFLQDEMEEVWEKMISQGFDRASCQWGPFSVEIRPREKYAA